MMGATVTAAEFTTPHAFDTRTQNCVGVSMSGVAKSGELPPRGLVKSSTGPSYH